MLFPLAVFLLAALVAADFQPNTTITGNVPVVTDSASAFDGPMVQGVNSSSFDWWYFDAVSADGTAAITLVFFRTIIFGTTPSATSVQVTVRSDTISIDDTFPSDNSSVEVNGYGARGNWPGAGSFVSDAAAHKYRVNISTDLVQGSLSIQSIAPGHYPDGNPPGSQASVLVAPGLYWTNAIPGGVANGKFMVQGQEFEIVNGVGYHDHNWGGMNVVQTVKTWYWGHATVGPFTFVWFDIISALTGTRYSSTYLAQSGHLRLVSQATPFSSSNNFTIVVPYGNGTVFPPSGTANLPSAFLIDIVGTDSRWSFSANAVNVATNSVRGFYTRWIGTVTGGEVGGHVYEGSGVWEWIKFI
jgi:hypothetical protein